VSRIVESARRRLQTSLPILNIGITASQEPSEWLRDQRRIIYGIAAEAFDKRPDLLKVEFKPKIEYADGDRTVELKVLADFKVVIDGHPGILAGVTAADLVADATNNNPMDYKVLQAKRRAYSELVSVLSLPYLESQKEHWEGEFAMTISRDEVVASMLNGVLDVDGLIARGRGFHSRFYAKQADLSRAPAIWNAATIATIPERLAAGMPPHLCDDDGVSAIVAAVATGNAAAVESLLGAGADPDRVDCAGFNAVAAAIIASNLDMFKRLVAAGANPAGPASLPSILLALKANDPVRTLGTLLDAGVEASEPLPNGQQLLEYVEEEGGFSEQWRKTVVAFLLARSTQNEIAQALGEAGTGASVRRSLSKTGPSL
jgi:hypothetical protein